MGAKIVEKRAVGDRDAVREAGRSAGILEIADLVGVGRAAASALAGVEAARVSQSRTEPRRRAASPANVGELGGNEEQGRVGAVELDLELVDIGVAAAEAGRERQRHRPGAGIDRAEESGGEFGAGLGDQGEPVARLDSERDEAAGVGKRVLAKLANKDRPGRSVPRASWKFMPLRPSAA